MIKTSALKRRFFATDATTEIIEITIFEKCSEKVSKNVLTNRVWRGILQSKTKKYIFGGFSTYGN